MNEDINQNLGGSADPGSGHIDPALYNEAVRRLQGYESAWERMNPIADQIKLMVDDPEAVEVFKNGWTAYQDMKKRQQPQVPAGMEALDKNVSKLVSFMDRYEAQEREREEAPKKQWQAKWERWLNDPDNERFYLRLKSEQPQLFDESHLGGKPMMDFIAQYAASQDFAPLSEVWKKYSNNFVQSAPTPVPTPPKSLVAGDGEPGIPGTSPGAQQTGKSSQQAMHDRLIQLEQARRHFGTRSA